MIFALFVFFSTIFFFVLSYQFYPEPEIHCAIKFPSRSICASLAHISQVNRVIEDDIVENWLHENYNVKCVSLLTTTTKRRKSTGSDH